MNARESRGARNQDVCGVPLFMSLRNSESDFLAIGGDVVERTRAQNDRRLPGKIHTLPETVGSRSLSN
jgi:hypothetical protein